MALCLLQLRIVSANTSIRNKSKVSDQSPCAQTQTHTLPVAPALAAAAAAFATAAAYWNSDVRFAPLQKKIIKEVCP